jgi:anti-sigma28 factor (negative regulator of flagellin synthesis)
MVRLMNTKEDQGNLTYFPEEKWRREHSGTEDRERNSAEDGSPEADQSPTSGEVLLKTLEEPFESAGRSRRIARLREMIRDGRYHVPALELAERMLSGDGF